MSESGGDTHRTTGDAIRIANLESRIVVLEKERDAAKLELQDYKGRVYQVVKSVEDVLYTLRRLTQPSSLPLPPRR